MSIVTRSFDLCIIPGAIPPRIEISQYDTAVEFVTNLVDKSGHAFDLPSGSTATVVGINRNSVPFDINCTIDGSEVSFIPSGAMVDCYGQQRVTLTIENSDTQFSPLAIIFDIQKSGRTKEEAAGSQEFKDATKEAFREYVDETGVTAFGSKYQVYMVYMANNGALTAQNLDEGGRPRSVTGNDLYVSMQNARLPFIFQPNQSDADYFYYPVKWQNGNKMIFKSADGRTITVPINSSTGILTTH